MKNCHNRKRWFSYLVLLYTDIMDVVIIALNQSSESTWITYGETLAVKQVLKFITCGFGTSNVTTGWPREIVPSGGPPPFAYRVKW